MRAVEVNAMITSVQTPMRSEWFRCHACGARFAESPATDRSGPPCPRCGTWQLRATRDPGTPAEVTGFPSLAADAQPTLPPDSAAA